MKKINKHFSQTLYLFFIYGCFTLILLSIFFIFTYAFYYQNTMKQTRTAQENLCASVENSVKTQLDNLATISLNIVYSNIIKSNFKEFSDSYRRTGIDLDELADSHEKALAIHDVVTAMIGVYQSASGIKLYTMDGSCVEAGYWLRTYHANIESLYWYDDVMRLNGHKYISVPQTNKDLPATGSNYESKKFISFIRLFLDSASKPEGIVEVVQDCHQIFELPSRLEQNNPDIHIFIYNASDQLVYPYVTTDISETYQTMPEIFRIENGSSKMITTDTGREVLISIQSVPEYDWNIIVSQEKSAIYKPLTTFLWFFLPITALASFFTLLVCFYISRQFSRPLKKLTEATGKITINRILDEKKVNLTTADSNITELSKLCESIRSMYEKLRSTSQEVLLAHNEEARAKLQATQSVINPHFLYNSLTNIGIMAEEEMNDDIIHMCNSLCGYFRYVSSSGEMLVKIEDELFYAERYLECMQLRFHDEFTYFFHLEEETKKIYIPKLIVQPILENAFKYAFISRPPWVLSISSFIKENRWAIRIEDNGGTLTENKKTELMRLYQNLNFNQELKSMKIGGMGLKNVYLRLKLVYGKDFIFEIDTDTPGKTTFILGGTIHYAKEDYHEFHLEV